MTVRFRFLCYLVFAVVIIFTGLTSFPVSGDTQSTDDQYRLILIKDSLSKYNDVEVLVREHAYPPGWKAPTHYHDGDLFIYVLDGEFEVITQLQGRVVYTPGQAMVMKAETVMDARNVSDKKPLKLVVFQAGKSGDPFLVKVDGEK